MIRRYSALAIILMVVFSCKSRYDRAMLGGKVSQVGFVETIPFDFSFGIPIIEVGINEKVYNFLFDTGAPMVLSKELAATLSLKEVTTADINDSSGKKGQVSTVILDQIRIGSVDFSKVGSLVMDYNKVFELSCMEISGIVGANLMAQVFWELDYEKEEMRFSDDRSVFALEDYDFTLPFIVHQAQQTPKVKIRADDITYNRATFDTGASGDFGLVIGKAKKLLDSLSVLEMKGISSVGVYGDGDDSSFKYAWMDSIKLGNLVLEDQFIEFESKGSVTLGNKFLKGYKVFMDWEQKEILLDEIAGFDSEELNSFGFRPRFREGEIIIGTVIKGSQADSLGMRPGEKILELGGVSAHEVERDMACERTFWKSMLKLEEVDVTFLNDSLEVSATLALKNYALKDRS